MALSESDRIEFKEWLVRNELDERLAGAILETMPRDDWSELVTKADLSRLESRFVDRSDTVDTRFDAVDTRFDAVDARFDTVDTRFDAVDARFDAVDARFDAVDARFDGIDKRLDGMDHRFDLVDQRFENFEHRLDTLGQQLRSFQVSVDTRFASLESIMTIRFDAMAKDMRVVLLAMMGFLFTALITLAGGGLTLLLA